MISSNLPTILIALSLLWAFSSTLVNGSSEWSQSHMIGSRSTIVQMFEWRFDDVADECERFLGPNGYGGVQISPPNEHSILVSPSFNPKVVQPWYQRYQAVSYKLVSRSGSAQQLADMVHRCNKANVRVYIDMVINHMTGSIGSGTGSAGSYFDPAAKNYTGVPYVESHFNSKAKCGTKSGNIEDFTNAKQIRDCELVGLHDLDHSQVYVRDRIVEYFNELVDYGVAGFRVDASSHIWPSEMELMFKRVKNLNTEYFPLNSRPLMYHEAPNELYYHEYAKLGRVIEFKLRNRLERVFRRTDASGFLSIAEKINSTWGVAADDDAVTIIDNHDAQREEHAYGNKITFREPRVLKIATAFYLAWPYGLPKVLSSYDWPTQIDNKGVDANTWMGPPHEPDYTTSRVKINEDKSCGGGWICEHRWKEISRMVQWRLEAQGQPLDHLWTNNGHQIAFSRGSKGFIAINNEVTSSLQQRLKTGLSAGIYCDIFSENEYGDKCSGLKVQVDGDGYVSLNIGSDWEIPMIALLESRKI